VLLLQKKVLLVGGAHGLLSTIWGGGEGSQENVSVGRTQTYLRYAPEQLIAFHANLREVSDAWDW
jgi:hypothetical protein